MSDRADRPEGAERRTFVEEARRAQIVAATVEVIAEVGYARATFALIAARVGISPGLISYHFGSKDELMDQVVQAVERSMDAAILAEVGEPESYAAAIRGVIEAQVRYVGGHLSEVQALGEVFRHAGGTPAGRSAGSRREAAIGELEEMFREGQTDGELAEFDPRPMAVTLMAALESVPGELLAHPETDAASYARELADLFERATQRRARRGRRR